MKKCYHRQRWVVAAAAMGGIRRNIFSLLLNASTWRVRSNPLFFNTWARVVLVLEIVIVVCVPLLSSLLSLRVIGLCALMWWYLVLSSPTYTHVAATALAFRSRRGIMDGLRRFIEADHHSAVDVGGLRRGTISVNVKKPQFSEFFPEAFIR